MKWIRIWTHVWAWWSAEGKKGNLKKSATVPVHLAFNWDGLKSNSAYFLDPTFINSELALNQ